MSYILNTEIPNRTVFLDSVNAASIMATNELTGVCQSSYQWYLSNVITCPQSYNMLISLVDAQFSNIFPQVITGFNDKFSYFINGVGTLTLTLPSQHYTVETLASYISTNTTLTVSIDYVNFKLQFTTSGSNFTILSTSTCGGLIGLTRDQYGNYESATSFANTLIMPSWFNLSGTPYVFVNVRNIIIQNLDSGSNSAAMTRVDINAPYGYTCFYRPSSLETYVIEPKKIDSFKIDLTDHYNNPLCLKGLNLQLTFRISFIKSVSSTSILDNTIDKTLYQNYALYGSPTSYHLEEKPEIFGADE